MKDAKTTLTDKSKRRDVETSIDTIIEAASKKLSEKESLPLASCAESISQEIGCNKDLVIKSLMKARESKKFRLIEGSPYTSLAKFAFSPYGLWFWISVVATLISFILIFESGGLASYFRYAFESILLIFLPGYSIVEMTYPNKDQISDLTRAALSVAISLGLVALVGLFLNYTPLGIRLIPVVSLLCGLTIIFFALALGKKFSSYRLANLATVR